MAITQAEMADHTRRAQGGQGLGASKRLAMGPPHGTSIFPMHG
jgi:hypothetical protein